MNKTVSNNYGNSLARNVRLCATEHLHKCWYVCWHSTSVTLIHIIIMNVKPLDIRTTGYSPSGWHPQLTQLYITIPIQVELAYIKIISDKNEVWAQDLYHSTALVEAAKVKHHNRKLGQGCGAWHTPTYIYRQCISAITQSR